MDRLLAALLVLLSLVGPPMGVPSAPGKVGEGLQRLERAATDGRRAACAGLRPVLPPGPLERSLCDYQPTPGGYFSTAGVRSTSIQ